MNFAATHVVQSIPEIVLAYGVSDEFSFVFHRTTALFERRRDKIVSTVVSAFTAAYVLGWKECFAADDKERGEGIGGEDGRDRELKMHMLPTFDGRAVCYPSWENLRDYLRWRQVDCMVSLPLPLCVKVASDRLWATLIAGVLTETFFLSFSGHINNLYNTTFWALVQQGGMTHTEAEEHLKGTVSGDKNEILWSRFGINYNNEPEMYKKGSVVFREYALKDVEQAGEENAATRSEKVAETCDEDDEGSAPTEAISKTQAEKMRKARAKAKVVTKHVDIIRDEFWIQRPWIRSGKPGRPLTEEQSKS